jgi:hypothetical protein
LNQDSKEPVKTLKSKDSHLSIPLSVLKLETFFEELEKDQVTGIVEITAPHQTMRIFLKKGKALKCFINDREASPFEIDTLEKESTLSIYRMNEQVLDLMALFTGAEPREILSSEYADIKKYLQIKERDHFSGIVEFFEEGTRGFLRLDNGNPQNGIFISEEGVFFFSDALSKIIDESRKFQIRSYDIKTVDADNTEEILSHTAFTVYHKTDSRRLLTEFEMFTPENAEDIGTFQLHPRQDHLYIVEGEKEVIGLEFVYRTSQYRFVQWVLQDLFLELAQKNVNSYRYLWYWIPECDTVEFLRPIAHNVCDVVFKTKNGDLLMQNPRGELLFVAAFAETVSRERLQQFMESVKQIKEARIDKGDLGAVFLVGKTVDKEALQLAEDITQKSIADKLAKLKGFVRISREAGVHLVLVKEDDPFTVVFPR